jgi:hypothetical protein
MSELENQIIEAAARGLAWKGHPAEAAFRELLVVRLLSVYDGILESEGEELQQVEKHVEIGQIGNGLNQPSFNR